MDRSFATYNACCQNRRQPRSDEPPGQQLDSTAAAAGATMTVA